MSTGPDLAVVVLNFNGADLTAACVGSVLPALRGGDRLLVVDNGSRPDDRARLDATVPAEDPRVRVLRLPENVGFSGGMNRGFAETEEPLVVLLNNDVVLEAGWREALAAPFADARVAVSFANLAARGEAAWARSGVNVFGQTWAEPGAEPRGPFRMPGGACLAVRRAAVEAAGGLFPDYFAYYEDVDLAWRLSRGGWTMALAEGARGTHVGEATLKRDPHSPFALRLMALRMRNKHLTFWRHATRGERLALAPWLWGLDLARIGALLLTGKGAIARARARGLAEYVRVRRRFSRTGAGARGFLSVDFRPKRW